MATTNTVNALSYPTGIPQIPQMQMMNPMANVDMTKTYVKKIRTTAIVTLIGGTLIVLLGIVTMILWGHWSFFAVPLWTGIGFFVVTGSIGIKASKRRNRSWIKAYIVMSTISCAVAAGLVVYYCFVAILEDGDWYYNGWNWNFVPKCQPGGYGSYVLDCHKSKAARITFDSLIAVTSFALFLTTLVAASYGCCATCKCCMTTCRPCCKSCSGEGCAQCCCGGGGCESCCSSTPPTTVAFSGNISGQIQGGIQLPNQPVMYIVQPSQVAPYPQVAAPFGAAYPPVGAPVGAVYPPAGAPGGVVYVPSGAPGAQVPTQGYPACTNQALVTDGSNMVVVMPAAQAPPPQYHVVTAGGTAAGQHLTAQTVAAQSSDVTIEEK